MGARTQVVIIDEHEQNKGNSPVMLYSHWGADRMEDNLKQWVNDPIVKSRVGDKEYLARIIFDKMIGSSQGTETGFGIGVSLHGDLDNYFVIHEDGEITMHDWQSQSLDKSDGRVIAKIE